MATIISRGERVEVVSYSRSFRYVDCPSAGRSFDCDEHGTLLKPSQGEYYAEALRDVAAGEMIDEGIETYEHGYWEPAVIKCTCGRELALADPMDNECHCGALYNGSGQSLRPRREWGEETGETYADIMSGRDPESLGFPYAMEG